MIYKLILFIFIFFSYHCNQKSNKKSEWFFPQWAVQAKYNEPIQVLDTQSALGTYAAKTKALSLIDLVRAHGHLCDGLVISYVEIKTVLKKLFPNGIIDRTDLRVVSKNGPCWVDTAALMTGARTNFATLSIEAKIGDGFIIQKISTGEAFDVHLKPNIFPKKQAELEAKIRLAGKTGQKISLADIKQVEKMADELNKKLLNTHPSELLSITTLPDFHFECKFSTTSRGDIMNKDVQ